MAEGTTTDTPDTEPDSLDTTTATPDTDQDTTDTVSRSELDKVIAQRDKLKAKLREASATKPDEDKPSEPSEADKLRDGMKRAAARAVLAGSGITDKADQASVLEVLSLDGVDVDDSGEVDTDALEERVAALRKLFTPKPERRSATRPDTRDRGGSTGTTGNRDSERYQRFVSGR